MELPPSSPLTISSVCSDVQAPHALQELDQIVVGKAISAVGLLVGDLISVGWSILGFAIGEVPIYRIRIASFSRQLIGHNVAPSVSDNVASIG